MRILLQSQPGVQVLSILTTDEATGVEAMIGEAIYDQYRHVFSTRGQFT